MLKVNNLCVQAGDHPILQGVSFEILPGELIVLTGENGSGKSTLCSVLSGGGELSVTADEMTFQNKDLQNMLSNERALQGLFVSSQEPVVIAGLSWRVFLQAALQERQKSLGEEPLEVSEINTKLEKLIELVRMPSETLDRGINEGHSGGEKKRMEMLQWLLFAPKLSVLDELDAGLDQTAKKQLAELIGKAKNSERSILVVSHDAAWADSLQADQKWTMQGGKLKKQA